MLKYPTLVLGILGSMPTLLTAFKSLELGVDFSKVDFAEAQSRMWNRNSLCYRNARYAVVRTDAGQTIRVLPCPSGDVLIEVQSPSSPLPVIRWIEKTEIIKTGFRPGELQAQVAPHVTEMLCYRVQEQNTVVARVIRVGALCYKEKISIYKGEVLESLKVPCPVDDDQCRAVMR